MSVLTGKSDSISAFIREMSLSDLQDTVLRLAESSEHVREALQRLVKEKERQDRLQRGAIVWEKADWLEAEKHFELLITNELEQCAELFEDRYERPYNRYGRYNDYDDEDERWDYSAGLERLGRWFAELAEMAADGEWIDAAVGTLHTLRRLEDWAIEHEDTEYSDGQLREACVDFWTQAEELLRTIRESAAPDSSKHAFFLELIDWIAALSREEEDWSRWMELLGECVVSSEHYQRLKSNLIRLEPTLLEGQGTAAPLDAVRWWVRVSLDADCEAEAERLDSGLDADEEDVDILASFARYYERNGRTDEAIDRLTRIVRHYQERVRQQLADSPGYIRSGYVSASEASPYFEWLIERCEQAGRLTEAEAWRVEWFRTLPSLELFQQCLEAVPPEEKERRSAEWIAHVSNRGRDRALLIDMYLHLAKPDEAWHVFEVHFESSAWINDSVRRLFEAMKRHDPKRLVAVFQKYAGQHIARKNRSDYERAAVWLTELKSAMLLSDGTAEKWESFIRNLKENYRRLPALQDELRKAGL